jgi:hypothetical protein
MSLAPTVVYDTTDLFTGTDPNYPGTRRPRSAGSDVRRGRTRGPRGCGAGFRPRGG